MNTKKKLLSLVRLDIPATREALVALCHSTTHLTIKRDVAIIKRDERLADIKAQCDPEIDALDGEIERNVKRLHTWAQNHRTAEFGGKQGINVAGCTLEFRRGTGKVVADVDDKTALDNILSLPEQFETEQEKLTRIKCELNKPAVIAMAKTEEGRALLAQLGLRLVVEEEFKFTPAREDLTEIPVVSAAAA